MNQSGPVIYFQQFNEKVDFNENLLKINLKIYKIKIINKNDYYIIIVHTLIILIYTNHFN